jgi:hypothetical protein
VEKVRASAVAHMRMFSSGHPVFESEHSYVFLQQVQTHFQEPQEIVLATKLLRVLDGRICFQDIGKW